jgi:hypothetical protein
MDLTPAMKTGDEIAIKEWLLEAEKLIETFRETRRLFLSTRVSDFPFIVSVTLTLGFSLLDSKGCSEPNASPKRMRRTWRRGSRSRWVSLYVWYGFSTNLCSRSGEREQ